MAKDHKFQCPKENCEYVTRIKQRFDLHSQIHEPHSISCPEINCSYTTNQESYLKKHMRIHSDGVKQFKCTLCLYTTHHRSNLAIHVRVHTKETPYKCPEPGCNYQTAQSSHLKGHSKVHSNVKQFKCPLCNYAMKNKRNFRNHLSLVHGEDLSSMASQPCKICPFPIDSINCHHFIETPFQCPMSRCKFRSRTQEKLNGHQLSGHQHSKEKTLQCPHTSCEFTTAHRNSLRIHVQLHEENPEKLFHCPLCPYKHRVKSYVGIHLRSGIHDGKERQRKFKCPESGCNYSTFQKSHLPQHLETHNTEKSFKCLEPNCSYRTHRKRLLMNHANIHSEERPWKCNLCFKTFRQSGNLAAHIRTHTKETLYKCSETGCKFQAYTKKALTIHLKGVHWNVRPFKCPMCKYAALTKAYWILHQRRVHGKVLQRDILGCTVCGCGVVAKNEKELAIHFTSKHNLPRVLVVKEMI